MIQFLIVLFKSNWLMEEKTVQASIRMGHGWLWEKSRDHTARVRAQSKKETRLSVHGLTSRLEHNSNSEEIEEMKMRDLLKNNENAPQLSISSKQNYFLNNDNHGDSMKHMKYNEAYSDEEEDDEELEREEDDDDVKENENNNH